MLCTPQTRICWHWFYPTFFIKIHGLYFLSRICILPGFCFLLYTLDPLENLQERCILFLPSPTPPMLVHFYNVHDTSWVLNNLSYTSASRHLLMHSQKYRYLKLFECVPVSLFFCLSWGLYKNLLIVLYTLLANLIFFFLKKHHKLPSWTNSLHCSLYLSAGYMYDFTLPS